MGGTSRFGLIAGAAIAVGAVALLGAYVIGHIPVTVPASAGTTLVARTTLAGVPGPDPSEGVDPSGLAPSPAAQVCLSRIERPEGWLDLCWEAFREMGDGSPTQDYYGLRVYGTFSGEGGSGARWTAVRARLLGEPSQNAMSAWPNGTYDGPCQEQPVDLQLSRIATEMVCGLTTGVLRASDWSVIVTWSCAGCVWPDHSPRNLALYEFVAVPEGTVPNWEIFADVGT